MVSRHLLYANEVETIYHWSSCPGRPVPHGVYGWEGAGAGHSRLDHRCTRLTFLDTLSSSSIEHGLLWSSRR